MKQLITLLLVSNTMFAFAQQVNLEFGKVTKEELEMNAYELDPSAEAVVLYDKGESYFFDTNDGYDIRFTRHKRIKILTNEGFEFAEIGIPFYVDGSGRTEEVKVIEAYTFNEENGSISRTTLDPSTVYEEKLSEKWRQKKFVFPNVQVGSVLDLRIVFETPFHFNLPDWTFQDKIPTVYSEYVAKMIPFYEYVFLAQGISAFDYQNSELSEEKRIWGTINETLGKNYGTGFEYQDYVHTYVLKDIPALKDESFISSVNDYIIKMDFQLAKFNSLQGSTREIMSTWPKLNEALLSHENFGKYIKSCSKYAKTILSENPEIAVLPLQERSIALVKYVREKFTWNDYNSKYASQSAKDFYTKKTGNAADINLFLIALLREADVSAEPIILSTRSHGKIPNDYPFDHFTNYVVVLVNTDSPFLTDATEDQLTYNRLPTRCLNEKGLLVNKEDPVGWVNINGGVPSLEKSKLAITIDTEELIANATVTVLSTEYDAYKYRSYYEDDSTSIAEAFSEKVGNINRLMTRNYKDATKPYTIGLQTAYDFEVIGESIAIKPFFNLCYTKNPLTQKARNYPLDFIYPFTEVFESTLTIPEGFKVSSMPESYTLSNTLVDVYLKYEIIDNVIKIDGSYQFKEAQIHQQYYSRVKSYFNIIVEKFNEQIVLEKI